MFREKDRERKRERKETEKKRSRMTDCSTQRINILTPRMEKERERDREIQRKEMHANLPEEVGTDIVAYDDSKYLRSTPLCTHQ